VSIISYEGATTVTEPAAEAVEATAAAAVEATAEAVAAVAVESRLTDFSRAAVWLFRIAI